LPALCRGLPVAEDAKRGPSATHQSPPGAAVSRAMHDESGERHLVRILSGLGPYLPHVVLIGGWVPYLYRRYGGFPEWTTNLSLTQEADLLLTPGIAEEGRPPLDEVLRTAGFRPVSDATLPAVWEDDGPLARIEFLIAHDGPFGRLRAARAAPGQPGVGAIPLSGLALLEAHTQTLAVSRSMGGAASAGGLEVRVPTLGAYVVNKAATFAARTPLRALKAYVTQNRQAVADARAQATARERAQQIRDESARQQADLGNLTTRLDQLATKLGTQRAGYEFQNWFYDLLGYFEVINRRPYIVEGRQIDGSATVEGTTYLVELKFTQEQAGSPDVDVFFKKVHDKADNTMGIMVSIAGYSSVAIDGASGPRTPLLLFDHQHLYRLLGGTITFAELVGRTRRHSSQTGRAYLSGADM
jgi:hypothetical protein